MTISQRRVETDVAAHYAGVTPAAVRQWASRTGTGVTRYPDGYDLTEIAAFLERRNKRMIRAARTEQGLSLNSA